MTIQYRDNLVDLLRHYNLPLTGVCVGVAEANFDRDLLNHGMDKLYSVDNYATIPGQSGDGGNEQSFHDRNYQSALEKLTPFGDKSIILKGMSFAMADHVPDKSLGLVYLDGDHSFSGVHNDLKVWFPKLVDGGIMAGHDFLNNSYGVKQAVEYFCKGKYEIHVIPENKSEDSGFWFQIK